MQNTSPPPLFLRSPSLFFLSLWHTEREIQSLIYLSVYAHCACENSLCIALEHVAFLVSFIIHQGRRRRYCCEYHSQLCCSCTWVATMATTETHSLNSIKPPPPFHWDTHILRSNFFSIATPSHFPHFPSLFPSHFPSYPYSWLVKIMLSPLNACVTWYRQMG